MGEANEPKKTELARASEDAMVVDTMGGRMHVRWDETAQATPHGQIVFFAEFLATAGVFDRWVEDCPLHYSSPNASRPRDVLGTLMLGILAGSKRYAHIAGVCGDTVAAKALGLRGMVSEDSVRRALAAMKPEASEPWMRSALMASVREALDRPWVLDMDATIKPLYGRQEGAEVGYNPHKPGRPSHVLHTFWVGNLRLVLDAVLSSGKQHTSGHAKAAMARLLDELGDKAPALVRGDCGYGNEDIIDMCEQRGLRYLLRLRKTANVKRLIERLFRREDWTRATEASQGWQAIEDELRLSDWSKARRVVVLRRRIKNDIALTAKKPALPRPLRLRERVRRVEEPMGPGRLHHAGHAPQPGHRAGGGAGLQLVELVRARSQPAGPARGADESATAAGGRGSCGQQRQPDHAVPHTDACPSELDQVDDRQCSCGHPTRQRCCGAVAKAGLLAGAAGLHLPAHRGSNRRANTAAAPRSAGVTAVFRLICAAIRRRWGPVANHGLQSELVHTATTAII